MPGSTQIIAKWRPSRGGVSTVPTWRPRSGGDGYPAAVEQRGSDRRSPSTMGSPSHAVVMTRDLLDCRA
jgi:hypothetical protein